VRNEGHLYLSAYIRHAFITGQKQIPPAQTVTFQQADVDCVVWCGLLWAMWSPSFCNWCWRHANCNIRSLYWDVV